MKNWREYVGYQSGVAIRPMGSIRPAYVRNMFLEVKTQFDGTITNVAFEQHDIPLGEVNLTDEEVGAEVERLLQTFTHRVENDPIEIERAKFRVAHRSKRGPANCNFGKACFYLGSAAFDAPIIVTEYEEKFHIFQNPNFDDYGYIVED